MKLIMKRLLDWLFLVRVVGYDETVLAVGLGFTCHLVAMISNYLDIPLRYPMLHRGSRSLIYDNIMDKLSDSERELVLTFQSDSVSWTDSQVRAPELRPRVVSVIDRMDLLCFIIVYFAEAAIHI